MRFKVPLESHTPFSDDNDDCPFPPILCSIFEGGGKDKKKTQADNPDIPLTAPKRTPGKDPLFEKQWGMTDGNVAAAHEVNQGSSEVVVAIIDTGVDYTHEDLVENLWRNPGETGLDESGNSRETNGVDDDENGYIDDVVGWDFVDNDNKPYDMKGSNPFGGNPGHGTHCAGNAAARGNNSLGVKGVAPNVKIMALRFIGSKGEGSTEAAVNAIRYAIDNGATITSNSWGVSVSRSEAESDKILMEALDYSQEKGVLFVAAAGNGDSQGVGYDNDTGSKPGFPASFDHDIIISVAATDINKNLGSFSNWGVETVDIAAPGVKILSTTVGGSYEDEMTIPFMGKVPWAGTSMATPFVAGAAALYLSANPDKTWQEAKNSILSTATPTDSLSGKVFSGGRLNVEGVVQ